MSPRSHKRDSDYLAGVRSPRLSKNANFEGDQSSEGFALSSSHEKKLSPKYYVNSGSNMKGALNYSNINF